MSHLIIPDIHGKYEKLAGLLIHLGWRRTASGWRASDPDEKLVFLGDFIDRGPENAKVIKTVRDLIDSGKAHAIMGNHELNAIHFHTTDPRTGQPLRAHSDKNCAQHYSFLQEFPLGSAEAAEAIAWMTSLPLYREFATFRVVHACWSDPMIAALERQCPGGILSGDQRHRTADENDPLFDLVESVTKGPEAALPDGYAFTDRDGYRRTSLRLKWWASQPETWRDIAISVPEIQELPAAQLPAEIKATAYPATAKPVFFGHYWRTGTPTLQSPNAVCLDYSAGKDGPLMAYRVANTADHTVDLANIQQVAT